MPEPAPAPAPEPLLDLTTWALANTYKSGAYELSVYFKPVGNGLYDVVLVVYDTVSGEPIQATGYRTETVDVMPDLTGFTLVTTVRQEDGSSMDKYALFAESMSWEDVTTWVEISYDAAGRFLFAKVKTIESLEVNTLALPSLESILF